MVALEDGLCNPGDTVDVGNGIYMYKGARMTDHNMNKGGYGRISVEQAIWYSSNIGVAKTILKGYSDNPTKFVEGLYRIGMNASNSSARPANANAASNGSKSAPVRNAGRRNARPRPKPARTRKPP